MAIEKEAAPKEEKEKQAPARKKGKAADTWKTKRWYKIRAPKNFEEKEIGEAVSSEPKNLMGRTINITLREVTGNMPHQNVHLIFKVYDVKGESADTIAVGHEMDRGYLNRQTRRMHSIVPDVLDVMTKDGYALRIKSLSFAHGLMRAEQRKEVRRITEAVIKETSEKTAYDQLFQDMIYGKVSAEVYKRAKKIYPLTKSEIIKSTLLAAPEKT